MQYDKCRDVKNWHGFDLSFNFSASTSSIIKLHCSILSKSIGNRKQPAASALTAFFDLAISWENHLYNKIQQIYPSSDPTRRWQHVNDTTWVYMSLHFTLHFTLHYLTFYSALHIPLSYFWPKVLHTSAYASHVILWSALLVLTRWHPHKPASVNWKPICPLLTHLKLWYCKFPHLSTEEGQGCQR